MNENKEMCPQKMGTKRNKRKKKEMQKISKRK